MQEFLHILLGLALIAALRRSEDAGEYLVATIVISIPATDRFLVDKFVAWGYLQGPLWTGRSITHSLLMAAVVVGVAYYVGYGYAGVIGAVAAIVPDLFYGGVKLFFPLSPVLIGGQMANEWVSIGVGAVSGLVLLAHVYRLRRGAPGWGDRVTPDPATSSSRLRSRLLR